MLSPVRIGGLNGSISGVVMNGFLGSAKSCDEVPLPLSTEESESEETISGVILNTFDGRTMAPVSQMAVKASHMKGFILSASM